MDDFEESKRLRPFGKLAHTTVYVTEAYKGQQEDCSAENGEPQNSGEEVVQDEVPRLQTTTRGLANHCRDQAGRDGSSTIESCCEGRETDWELLKNTKPQWMCEYGSEPRASGEATHTTATIAELRMSVKGS